MGVYGGPNLGKKYYEYVNRVFSDNGYYAAPNALTLESTLYFIDQNPSLLTPLNAGKVGKVYSAIPNDGTGDFTVSRNGTATYLGSDGLLKTAQPNEPRLEFNPDGTFKGVLVEPSATNLVLRSEEFDDGYWRKFAGTIVINQILSPNNTLTADRFIEDTSTTSKAFRPGSISIPTQTGNHTYSIFVKRNGRDFFILQVAISLSIGARCNFNLLTGTISNPPISNLGNGFVDAKIQRFNNDWYRCSLSFNLSQTTGVYIVAYPYINSNTFADDGNYAYQGDGVSGLFIWGAQLEVGSVATSYIPTVASTVTRPADVISRTGIADLIGQTEGSFYIEFIGPSQNNRYISINSNNSLDNSILIGVNPSNQLNVRIITTWPNLIVNIGSFAFIPNTKYRLLFSYSPVECKIIVNGVIQKTGGFIGLSSILQTISSTTAAIPLWNIKNITLFKTALSDSQAIALTTL